MSDTTSTSEVDEVVAREIGLAFLTAQRAAAGIIARAQRQAEDLLESQSEDRRSPQYPSNRRPEHLEYGRPQEYESPPLHVASSPRVERYNHVDSAVAEEHVISERPDTAILVEQLDEIEDRLRTSQDRMLALINDHLEQVGVDLADAAAPGVEHVADESDVADVTESAAPSPTPPQVSDADVLQYAPHLASNPVLEVEEPSAKLWKPPEPTVRRWAPPDPTTRHDDVSRPVATAVASTPAAAGEAPTATVHAQASFPQPTPGSGPLPNKPWVANVIAGMVVLVVLAIALAIINLL